jgi:hypothetical protein
MKQTAVEWLIKRINQINFDYDMGRSDEALCGLQLSEAYKQAKEMEKQQIVEAFIGHDLDTEENIGVAKQYYNETFKSE